MNRHLPLIALFVILGLGGCGRHSDTNEPNHATPPPGESTDGMQESTPSTTDEGTGGMQGNENMQGDESMQGSEGTQDSMGNADSGTGATSTDTEVCTPQWFAWVHQQVLSKQDGKLTELYPSGLPEVGSDDWFVAIDKLTGGDGTQGPEGGSDEWCRMIQQRLANPTDTTP